MLPCATSEDYTEVLSHKVTFAPYDTELTANVPLVNNNLTEEIEVLSAELLSFGSKLMLANGRDTTSIEILDDDGKLFFNRVFLLGIPLVETSACIFYCMLLR